MKTRILSRTLALATGIVAATAMSAAGASAATAAAPVASANQAGYSMGGGWRPRFVSERFVLPPTTALPSTGLAGVGVQLSSPAHTERLFAVATTGASNWTIGIPADSTGSAPTFQYPAGSLLNISLYYSGWKASTAPTGTVSYTVTDYSDAAGNFSGSFSLPNVTFTGAFAGFINATGVIANTVTPPVTYRLAATTDNLVTSYNGTHGSFAGPWPAWQNYIPATSTTPKVNAPVLWNGGHNFGIWVHGNS